MYVPFFWTRIWDKSIAYAGQCSDWDEIYIQGEVNAAKQDFLAVYIKAGKIQAMSSMNRGRHLMLLAEAMRLGICPTAAEIKSPAFSFAEFEKKVKEQARTKKAGCKRCCHHKKRTAS